MKLHTQNEVSVKDSAWEEIDERNLQVNST